MTEELHASNMRRHLIAAIASMPKPCRAVVMAASEKLTQRIMELHEEVAQEILTSLVKASAIQKMAMQLMALRDAASTASVVCAKHLGLTLDGFLELAMEDFKTTSIDAPSPAVGADSPN